MVKTATKIVEFLLIKMVLKKGFYKIKNFNNIRIKETLYRN